MAKFDSKAFNPQAFGAYVNAIPNPKKAELAKSGAVGTNENARNALSTQTGSLYAKIPYFGRISGSTSQNNDGGTNIQSTNTTTYEQGFVTASRMDSWTERSFSKNITAGVDFMDNVGRQISDYKLEVKQNMLLSILKGIYTMSTSGGTARAQAANEFITKHTYDITGAATDEGKLVGASTLNSAISKACGDNKNIFKLVIMHSEVATHLENLRLLEYLKYTDKDGVQRDLPLATWNGRTVLIDDGMPTTTVVTTPSVSTIKVGTTATAGDKFTVCGTEIEWVSGTATGNQIKLPTSDTAAKEATAIQTFLSGITTGEIANFTWTVDGDTVTGTQKLTAPDAEFSASVSATASTFAATITANATPGVTATNYTTYVLGDGAIVLEEIGDSVPYEMSRDPKTNGGQDTLYVRDRYICGVDGISFDKPATITASASNADLANGENWEVINDGTTWIPHKAIAIARIISRG